MKDNYQYHAELSVATLLSVNVINVYLGLDFHGVAKHNLPGDVIKETAILLQLLSMS